MNRILFLDVDGVLNHQGTYRRYKRKFQNLDEENLMVLKEIVDVFRPQIVLSSTWRYFPLNLEVLLEAFEWAGIPKWIDETPILDGNRYKEIKAWMHMHSIQKEEIVIVDDYTKLEELSDRLVQTDFLKGGLQKEHMKRIRKLFKEGNNAVKNCSK